MATESSGSQNKAHHNVFIDTNLDTHLVMTVADDDTVDDFKQKLSVEHRGCFPNIGEITVHSLRVKRKGCLYKLSNSILVKTAFDGVQKNWFLDVDAACSQVKSIIKPLYLEADTNTQPELLLTMDDPAAEVDRKNIYVDHNSEKVSSPDDSAPLQAGCNDLVNKLDPLIGPDSVDGRMTNIESPNGKFLTAEHHKSSLDESNRLKPEVPEKNDFGSEGHEVPQTNTECKKEKHKKRKKGTLCNDALREHESGMCMSSEDTSKLKNKTKIIKAKLDGLSNKQSVHDHPSSLCLVSEASKDKTNSSDFREKVDLTLVSSAEKARHETSKEASESSHKELPEDADVTVPSQQKPKNLGVLLEKNIHCSLVEEIEEGNSISLSSGNPHGMSAVIASVGQVDMDFPQDVDMDGASGSKLESRVDASEKTVASGVRKAKKSKKHQAANAVEAETNKKDGILSFNPSDASQTVETEDPGRKKRRKSKHNKDADDIIPSTSNHEKSKEESRNTDKELLEDADVTVPPQQTAKNSGEEKEIHYNPVEKIGEGNPIPLSSLDKTHAMPAPTAAVADIDSDSPQDVDMGGASAGKLESRVDASERTVASGGRQAKKSKKRQAAIAMKAETNMKDEVGSSNPLDASKAMESEDPGNKRRKKSKKNKEADAKSQLRVNSADNVDSLQTPSNALKYKVDGPHLVNGSTDGAKDCLEVPKNVGDEVNFRDYFVPQNDNHKVVTPAKEPVEKDVHQQKMEKDLKAGKKTKTKPQNGSSDTFAHQRSKLKFHSNENAFIIAGEMVKATLDEDNKMEDFPVKVPRNKFVGSSEDIRSLGALQNHSSSGVNVHPSPKANGVAERKPHMKKTGDVLNRSQNRKSLLAVSNSIFSESSTESYEDKDEDEKHNSDARTRSPSDKSSSSDDSEGENEVNMNSPRSGSYGRKIMVNSGNSNTKSQSQITAREKMALGTIFKGSKSYKMAKLVASQSQLEDTESQPIPFNLDSQA